MNKTPSAVRGPGLDLVHRTGFQNEKKTQVFAGNCGLNKSRQHAFMSLCEDKKVGFMD